MPKPTITPEITELVTSLYATHTNREITAETGLSDYFITRIAKARNLKKLPGTRSRSSGKTQWTAGMDAFLRDNWQIMPNRELAEALNLKLTIVRTRLYELGFKRQEMEYWTDEQVDFLKANYRGIGDSELAEAFAIRWPKKKGWSKKHIEKKRRYLKLERTLAERKAIRKRNESLGRWAEAHRKRWDKQGRAEEGEIRYWRRPGSDRRFPVIKVDGRWLHWAPWRWQQLHGPVPKGMNVVFRDGNPYNRDDRNLLLVTDAEMAHLNARKSSIGLSDNYVAGMLTHGKPEQRDIVRAMPELLELKRNQLLLQRELNKHLK